MIHTDIINILIQKYGFKSYLEVGVGNPKFNFNEIICDLKEGVDTYNEDSLCEFNYNREEFDEAVKKITYKMSSDEFFKTHENKYDIIFVDGLHLEEQCGRDIVNSLKHLNSNGLVVVHDCLPGCELHQRVPRESSCWNGDVWKCIPELEKQSIEYETVDVIYGCCIIKYKSHPEDIQYLDKSFYTYEDFEHNKKTMMHIITEEEFLKKYK